MTMSYPPHTGLGTTAGGPPPIPEARSDSTGHPRRPLLIWVRTGTAHVRIGGAVAFHLTAGEGAWIPADGWRHRAIVTEPGTVAFPLWPHPGAGPLSELTRFKVPDGWQDWLIQHFNLQVTPLEGQGYSQQTLCELLRRAGSHSPPPRSDTRHSAALAKAPPVPKAPAARAVAEGLMRDPAVGLTIHAWAARVASSPRSLLRDFLADTGLTFEQWRTQFRLTAGVEFLAAGDDVDQVIARVGFVSRSGFSRAFKERFGLTPLAFSRFVTARSAPGDLKGRATARRQANDLLRMVREDHASPAAPELLPPARTPMHSNDVHVLSWMYRGSGYLDIGDRRYERGRGVATWIPADVEHVTGIRENSASLLVGVAHTSELPLSEPLQVQFSPAWDNYLMFCSLSICSILQPEDYNPRHILDLFADQLAAQRALSVPMPTDPRARAAAMDYLRRIGSVDAPVPDLSTNAQRAFREQTGMTFARWRYAARMRIARDLLASGAKPSAVARRVGYGYLPNFSAAFSRFHGLSPREYQDRETETA